MPILAVGLVGAGLWGYQENHEKNSILIKAENQYQRAFHDLNSHLDKLQEELGKTIAVNSRYQLTPSLANVWRLAYSSQNDVGQLPLTLMPFNKTEEFLSNVANFSYKTAVRDLDKTPLSQDEYKTLQVLFNQSKEIQRDLQKVQTAVIDNQLRWMDVEKALAMEKKQEDNTIIDGLKMVDKNVESYQTNELGTGVGTPNQPKSSKSLSIKGKEVGTEEAKQNAVPLHRFEIRPNKKYEPGSFRPRTAWPLRPWIATAEEYAKSSGDPSAHQLKASAGMAPITAAAP